MVTCCVPECKSCSKSGNGKGISFHEFPTNRELFNIWVLNIPREDWQPSESAKVCGLHFEEECFVDTFSFKRKKKRLMKGSVPTIFPNHPASVSQAAKDRKPVAFHTHGAQDTANMFKSVKNNYENSDSATEYDEVILEIETIDLPEQQEATKKVKLEKEIYKNASLPDIRPDVFEIMPVPEAKGLSIKKLVEGRVPTIFPNIPGSGSQPTKDRKPVSFQTCGLHESSKRLKSDESINENADSAAEYAEVILEIETIDSPDEHEAPKKAKLDKDIYANAIIPDFRPSVFEMMPVAEATEAMDELHRKLNAERTRYARLKKQFDRQEEKISIFESKGGKDTLRYSRILKDVIKDAEDGNLHAHKLLKQLGAYGKNKNKAFTG